MAEPFHAQLMQFSGTYSYPFYFYLLEDGSWLIQEVNDWFHVPNLLPFLSGYESKDRVSINDLSNLQSQIIARIDMGFQFSAKGVAAIEKKSTERLRPASTKE